MHASTVANSRLQVKTMTSRQGTRHYERSSGVAGQMSTDLSALSHRFDFLRLSLPTVDAAVADRCTCSGSADVSVTELHAVPAHTLR